MQFTLQDAWSMHTRGQFGRAVAICDQLLRQDPDNASVLGCRAMSNWSRRHDVPGALVDMARVVSLAPDISGHRHNYATVLASVGHLDEARSEFMAALKINPKDTQAFYGLAQNARFVEEDENVRAMRTFCDQDDLPDAAREFASYGLAKIYDDLDRSEEAYRFARDANKLGARPFNPAPGKTRFAALQTLVENKKFSTVGDSDVRDISPIFIVGMPRSGTTLVESVLGRHPDVFAAGELPFMPGIEQRLLKYMREQEKVGQGPDFALLNVPPHKLRMWVGKVLDGVWKLADAKRLTFTDKLPHNAFRLGLISKLFPNARIIHVRRHPLDTGLSNFFMRFNSGHGYSNYLDKIGLQFRLVSGSIAAWRQLPDINILDVRYEDLVNNAEPVVRRLLDFAGLEFCEECLTPHRGHRGVMTASQWQVRQPIYDRSVARFQRYEQWLDPMISALGGRDWIDTYHRG